MLALAISGAHADSAETLVGFSKDQSGRQRDLEERFDAEVDKANIRALTKILSAKPHPAGSPAGAETAIFLAEQLTIWGYETKIEEFDVLLPIPKRQLVELISPEQFRASEQEPQLQGYARNPQDDVLPLFNAYSADGEATAAIVYVNYGRAADFAELESMGVDVNGKIVLARFGKIWRGLKAKFAAQHGALATVLYSDPQDDGYFVGAVIPELQSGF
jgi:N-acetylated-alpha-linked acidic dipeptidase